MRPRSALPVAIVIVILLGACAPGEPVRAEESPRRGGRFAHGVRADALVLNPFLFVDITSRLVSDLIYAKIARPDPNTGIVRPELAKWQVSADGLTYSWELQANATWSDGTPITAEDWLVGLKAVGRSKRTIFRSDFADIEGFAAFADGTTEEIRGVRIDPTDPKRWSVRFTRVFCPALSRAVGHLLPRQIFGKYVAPGSGDEIDRAPENVAPPVASGPFVFSEWRRGDRIVLRRNERYWKGAPLLEEYVIKVVADSTVLPLQLKSGELDAALVDPVSADMVKDDPRLRLHMWDGLTYYYIGWKVKDPRVPGLADERVRRALAHAVDVDGIIQAVLFGHGVRVHAHHPPASWAYTPGLTEYPYDLRRAEAMLREAGFARGADGIQARDGAPLRFTILTVAGDKQREAVAQIAAEAFRRIGVEATVRPEGIGAFADKLRTGSHEVEAWTGFWAPSVTDPDPYLFLGRDAIPDPAARREGSNFGGWSDPRAERELVEGRTPSDGDCSIEARKRRYAAFDRILNEQQPYLFLYAPITLHGVTRDLRGFQPGRFWPEWNVEQWWLAR